MRAFHPDQPIENLAGQTKNRHGQHSAHTVPEGSDFLVVSAGHQDHCAVESGRHLGRLDKAVQRTYENLGTLLSLLDRLASCFWGCHGKEHVIERLVGRSVSSARGALRLIEFGHYDEALALTRGIAEIGNLMWLFFISPEELRRWIDVPEQERRSRYSPPEVRKAIEGAGSVVPHDQYEYAWLCEVGVHPTPQTQPQAHNAHGVPTLGGVYQERGYAECLERLAWALASVGGPAAKIALIERSRAKRVVEASIQLVDSFPNQRTRPRSPEVRRRSLKRQSGWIEFSARRTTPAKNRLERTALRAAAEPTRFAYRLSP